MKKLEEATVEGATELGKRVLATGKTKGVVVIAYRHVDKPVEVVVRKYKKTAGWTVDGYQTHSARTWRALATAILDLTKPG